MALRFSGRFSVTVATPESIASWMVVYAMQERTNKYRSSYQLPTILIARRLRRRVRVPGPDFSGRAQQHVERFQGGHRSPVGGESFNHLLGRNIAHERILGKRATSQPAQGGVEAAAACVVGCHNLCCHLIRAAVQMNADFKISKLRYDRRYQFL